ncbi:MAG TPA: DUF4331 family protein [Candidatus Limnocylindrales bacterium]
MSDHRDTPDPRTDIADLYVFRAPGGGDQSVLVLNINPDASALESSFDPVASYELKIDTDGDLEADVAFHVIFASSSDGGSTATVYRSTGAVARGTGQIGEVVISNAPVSVGGTVQVVAADGYRFYSGLRSDPFFLDADGLRNGFQFTGHETFANRNVFGMVLEYDPSGPGGYPNGRRLTDDVVDPMIAMVTMGRVTAKGVGPHTDLLDEFPYLGAPHAVRG